MASKVKITAGSRRGALTKKKTKDHEQKIIESLALPNISFKHIRRHRMEYYKALCLELEEEDCSKASKLIHHLINLEEEKRNAAGSDSVLWYKPMLKHQNIMLDSLRSGLQQAEKEEKAGQYGRACFAYLNLALYFQDKGENWYWLADVLFNNGYQTGENYLSDGKRKGTIARYAYGKFLLENMKDERKALSILETTRSTSIGKFWLLPDLSAIDPSKDIPEKKDDMKGIIWTRELLAKAGTVGTVYEETCTLLQKLFHQMAKNVREQGVKADHDLAIKLCQKSLKRAMESEKTYVQAEALKDLGLCYIEKGDLHSAITYFEHLLKFSSQHGIWTAICEAHEQLGHAYTRLKQPRPALHHFGEFCKTALSFEASHLLGRAYRCLGVFHMIYENPEEATKHLDSAFVEYHLLKQKEENKAQQIIHQLQKIKRCTMISQDPSFFGAKNSILEFERLKEKEKELYIPAIETELEQTRVLGAIAKGLRGRSL